MNCRVILVRINNYSIVLGPCPVVNIILFLLDVEFNLYSLFIIILLISYCIVLQ